MARAYESGGGETGPNAGKTAAEIAAQTPARKQTSEEILSGVNQTLAGLDTTIADSQAAIDEANAAVLAAGLPTSEAADITNRIAEKADGGGGQQDNSDRQSAYDLLLAQFKQYGLEALVTPLKDLIADPSISESEFTLKLRDTDAYKKRFAANQARIGKGLRALSEGDYIALEDGYQNVMRNYGLPANYYAKGEYGRQENLEKFIAGDVSAKELEERIVAAQDFMDKGPKAYVDAIKQFYPEISRGDLLAYVLNPDQGLKNIQAKIGAAKIGGEYLNAGLTADQQRAEELQRLGVTSDQARQGAQQVKEIAPLGSQYAAMYGLEPYGQADVEEEVYGLGKAAEAKKKREKIAGTVTADFSGRSGVGILDANRSGQY